MEKLRRAIFFWTLFTAFIITAPVVVLHARGYRFDFSRGVFVYSGTITFKSNPKDISILLNDKGNISKKGNQINNSYNVSGLIPGEYRFEVSAPGFQSWKKKAYVQSGLSTEFWNVLLVREKFESQKYDSSGIGKFFISTRNKLAAYYLKVDNALIFKIINLKDNAVKNVLSFPEWNFIENERQENIEWSPEEDFLSLPVSQNIKKEPKPANPKIKSTDDSQSNEKLFAYFIIDASENTSFNLNDFIGKTSISKVRWSPKEKGFLYFLSDGSLWRMNFKDAASLKKIIENVSSYDITNDRIYYVQTDNSMVYESDLLGSAEKKQITSSFPENEIKQISRITVYDEDRIAMLSNDKELFIYNKGEDGTYFRKIGDNIEGSHFSDDGKKLLFFSDNGIFVYFIRKWEVQPQRNENELQEITRFAQNIDNVQWFWDYEHVIFSAGKEIKIIELDPRDRRICMDILSTSIDQPFVRYSPHQDSMFYTDNEGNVPFLFSIEFPEKETILGF